MAMSLELSIRVEELSYAVGLLRTGVNKFAY